MGSGPIPGWFVNGLRRALYHLYNPDELSKSALWGLLGLDPARDPLALQNILVEAVDALKPKPGTSTQAPGWRQYRALYHRYTEQFSQAEVARALGLSSRQLLRQERAALRALAAYLWGRYDLSGRAPDAGPSNQPAAGEQHLSRQQELAWLQESLPTEAIDLAEVAETVLQTAEPVLTSLAAHVEWTAPTGLPPLLARRGPLRQALLHLLLAAARSVPGGGAVRMQAGAQDKKIRVALRAMASPDSPSGAEDHGEALALARQLLAISGGTLEELPADTFAVALMLPATGYATVLFVDDNADALLLFRRCLAATRYHYAGTRDPQQAVALATELQPCAVVLDVMLPGIDGWEILGRLRANPATRSIPIFVCTILSDEQLALALGATAFLRKPVRPEVLLAALDEQLARRSGTAG